MFVYMSKLGNIERHDDYVVCERKRCKVTKKGIVVPVLN
jgi:hypothetical protein